MNRTAFVTGATGFLGLNLIEELSKGSWDIIAFHLPGADLKYLSRFNVTMANGNLNDYSSLLKAIPDEVDTIFHIAGNTSLWSKNNKQQYLDNVVGTQNMVNAAIEKKAKKFVHTSSISAFGYHSALIDETIASNALTCKMNYNITKYKAEQVVKNAASRGLKSVILNPINIIGVYDINGWAKMIKAVYHNELFGIPPGRAMFCHVKDIANAHINAVDVGGNAENFLLGGVEASFKEVFNEIERMLGKKLTTTVESKSKIKLAAFIYGIKSKFDGKEPLVTPEKYKRLVGSITCNYNKAKNELDYQTSSLPKMLTDSYEWLKKENLL
jgi:dihydroflavonol-4-reductase